VQKYRFPPVDVSASWAGSSAAARAHSCIGRSDAYLNDPIAIDLVDSLSHSSPRFKALWDSHDVRRADTDTLEATHPRGRLVLILVNLQGVATPGIRFNAYLPADDETAMALRAAALTDV
jgi:MmyB-like transcription regulator ligand binding domain